jgi:hypothetical protein
MAGLARQSQTEGQTEVQRRAERLRLDENRRRRLEDPGTPTPEQVARGLERVQIKDPDACEPRLALRNTAGNTLDRWKARGLINSRQWLASDRYRSIYLRAGLSPCVTSRYGPQIGAAAVEPSYACTMPRTLAQVIARDDWRAARAALPQTLVGLFDDVVLHEVRTEEADRAGGGRAGGRVLLLIKVCADELADFFKLPFQDERA